jgi:ferric-dicitrate binding protein FerR (iron transport regulator)
MLAYEPVNENYLSWMTGIFQFEETPILQAVEDLNTYYNGRISLDTTQNYTCNLNAQFERMKIEDIVEIIKTTCDLELSKSDDKYILR